MSQAYQKAHAVRLTLPVAHLTLSLFFLLTNFSFLWCLYNLRYISPLLCSFSSLFYSYYGFDQIWNTNDGSKYRIMQIIRDGKLLRFSQINLQSQKFSSEFFFLIIKCVLG